MPTPGERGAAAGLRIGILGDRGIPARYGGYSTLVEEVAARLVRDHGMKVTVYCRRGYYDEHPREYRGVHLVHLRSPGGKYFESLIHTFFSVIHSIGRRFDLIFMLDPGNSPLLLPLKARRYPVVLHTDGLGWQRRKWGRVARSYYKWSERLSARLATCLVTDARAMREYYREQYGVDSCFIPYGSRVGEAPTEDALRRHGLEPGGYYLVVARIEPENNTDLIIDEYRRSDVRRPLVIVGGAKYETEYSRRVFSRHGGAVRLLGPVYDSAALNGLYANAYAYIHGHEVGGTNPSLLRAMDAGRPCLCLSVIFHREVIGDAGVYFERGPGSLAAILRELEADRERAEVLGRRASERAVRRYRWDAVAAGYAALFTRIVEGRWAGERVGGPGAPEVYRPEEFGDDQSSPGMRIPSRSGP